MRQKCELHKRGTLIPSEAANWCEWINHLQVAIQNTYVWANGRTPPAWGEKLMCWWAMSQIFTGQIQDCRLFHYLPVSHPVIRSVFLLLSPSVCLSLNEVLAESMKRWKENKMPFDPAALCYSSVREHYHDNPTKKSAKGYQSQICRPLMHRLLMHRHRVWTGWLNKNAAASTRRPCQVPFSFHSLSWSFSFFTFPTAGSTKPSLLSQQYFQFWSNNCELHAMLHCWELYCFMFDIFTARGERYYPPVMRRT